MRSLLFTLVYLICMITANITKAVNNEPTIHAISYNVFFDDRSGKERYPEILKFLKEGQYNLIALQECTEEFIQLIAQDAVLSKLTLIRGNPKQGYSNIILTSLPLANSGDYVIPTKMGRSAPFVRLKQSNLLFINVHLESTDSRQNTRLEQINKLHSYFTEQDKVVILGDFNFGDGSVEEKFLKEFIDLGKEKNQVTYDVDNNQLASQTKDWLEKSRRLDRIMMRCKQCQANGFSVHKVNYSDHYPLTTTISKTQSKESDHIL